MGFAGKVWRLLVGIKDALALIFLLLFFSLLFAALGSRPNPGIVRDGALLIQLDGSVVEEEAPIDALGALVSGSVPSREYAARDLVRAIDEAARDERIKAIALDLATFTGGGQVHLQEVGDALARFRTTDKPIIAYGVAYTDDAILLAAHADEIWIDPLGGVAVQGPGGYRLYYSDALDRFDINARVYRVGTYKSAVEPYTETGMSEPARENAEAMIAALWEEWQAHVIQARAAADITAVTENLVPLLEEHGGNLAEIAMATGFADHMGTRDEWGARVAEIAGEDRWKDRPGSFASTDLAPYLADMGEPGDGTRSLTSSSRAIGVITIAGEITDGNAGPGSAGAERIVGLLDDALDDDLAALVVRVDSPGGTVTGSELIRRAILRHKDAGIPIAVSMGNYAASGGYWISTPANRIFAEPETLTGSIGVFMVIPTFEDLLAEYGISSDGVQTTPLSGQPDLFAGFTPETEALLQGETEAIYDRFLSLVAESRGLTPERVDELGQGRVWTGGTARQLGLVDQFGDVDAALEWAAAEAGLEEGKWHARYLESPPDPYAQMVQSLLGDAEAPEQALVSVSALFARQEQQLTTRVVSDLDRLLSSHGVQARCLECMPYEPLGHSPAARASSSWISALAARLIGN